jgi:hypothetical protein
VGICRGYARLRVECGVIMCSVRYTLYYETLSLAVSVSVPYAMIELRLYRGYAVARDALLRSVTFSCILYVMISHARRGFYGAFMSFLKGVFRLGLVW